MLGLDTRGRGRRVLFAAWMCRMTVVVAAAVAANVETLHSGSGFCNHSSKNTTLDCNITADKTYRLDNFKWESITRVNISNAPVLVLEEPLCSEKPREVVVYNSTRVTTEPGDENCSQQVIIHDSKNVRLIDGVDLVRMFNSEADEIKLPHVSQFDLTNSVVKKVSVRVEGKMSTLRNSTIEVVKAMVINGDFQFGVENSTLMEVEGFIYNSPKEATFNEALLMSVAHNGFVVQQGTVRIQDSLVGTIGALGLAVEGGTLVFVNSELRSVAFNSIVVSKGGSVVFENVTVATAGGIFFTISKGTMDLYPLALLLHLNTSYSSPWVVLFVGIGMATGLLVGAGVTRYMLARRGVATTEADTTELLNREPISQCQPPDSRPPKLPNYNNDKNKQKTELPLPSLPTAPEDDETYEKYSDVSVQPPKCLPSQRPPMPVPNESSSSGGSTLPMSHQHLAMPPILENRRDPRGAEMNDDRDKLPPPPPPDDEIYDELADLQPPARTKPLPPIPSSKPQMLPQKKAPLPSAPFRKH